LVLFVILFWAAILVVVMRLLTWIAKHHPKARNVSALVVETGVALALFEALADAGAAASGSSSDKIGLVTRALFFGLIAVAAHYFASSTAISAHALYPPFLVLGVAGLAWLPFPWLRWPIGVGMVVAGCTVGWLKYRGNQKSVASSAAATPGQA
jgi:hypothetical protein